MSPKHFSDQARPKRPAMSEAASYLWYMDHPKRESLRRWILRGKSEHDAAELSGATVREAQAMVERLKELRLLTPGTPPKPKQSKIERDAMLDKKQLSFQFE